MTPDSSHAASAVRHITWWILPLLFAAYFLADRVNVGFAALTMNKALALWRLLPALPADASWLPAGDKTWLVT